MKRMIKMTLLLVLVSLVVVGCGDNQSSTSNSDPYVKKIYGEISVLDYGKMEFELYPDVAPITVSNFQNLIEQNFYDGLIFHRVIDDFMVQGGGFKQDGTQKTASSIIGEFKANGYDNTLVHTRGVMSMARANLNNSGTSQFFIVQAETYPSLDGKYAAFGRVTAGLDIVDQIVLVEKDEDNKPLVNIVIEYIRLK